MRDLDRYISERISDHFSIVFPKTINGVSVSRSRNINDQKILSWLNDMNTTVDDFVSLVSLSIEIANEKLKEKRDYIEKINVTDDFNTIANKEVLSFDIMSRDSATYGIEIFCFINNTQDGDKLMIDDGVIGKTEATEKNVKEYIPKYVDEYWRI